MKNWLACLAVACSLASLPSWAPVGAQSIEARKIPDARFIRIEMIKFKPGGEDRAFDLEDKYINPARKLSGIWPLAEYHTQTGPWDRVYVWDLPDGLSDAEWQVDPSQAKFLAALSKIAGGNAKALAIMSEWNSLVERRETSLGHYHPRS
jgi:hypothetical protein